MRPKDPVAIEPLVKLGERLRAQGVDPELGLLANLDETSVSEDTKVARRARTSNGQQRCKLARGSRANAEGIENGPPARV
jgi:hypothetical protein